MGTTQMASEERRDLEKLLAQTVDLRVRFEAKQPDSQRLSILIRDELRLRRLLAEVA